MRVLAEKEEPFKVSEMSQAWLQHQHFGEMNPGGCMFELGVDHLAPKHEV